MATRRSAVNTKVLHSGHTFTSSESFPPGILPTKRQVIERVLHFNYFKTVEVANDIAKELHERWIWCNVYPLHQLTISKRIQILVSSFSALDRWSKKKRGDTFLKKESEFMEDVTQLFDVYCADAEQRQQMEKEYRLRMTEDDFAFYNDQKGHRIGRCLDAVIPLTSSDNLFIRRTSSQANASTSSAFNEQASGSGYVSDAGSSGSTSMSHLSQSSVGSDFVPDASFQAGQQNRFKWTNLARMCERYQLSDRAAAAIANSVLQDVGMITTKDNSYVIDRSKLRREREKCRKEIREKEQENFKFVDAVYFDGRKDATQVVLQGPNSKLYRAVQLEEHYTVVGEPGEYYLSHLSPSNGQGRTIAQEVYNLYQGTELEDKLSIIGTDGTASMTGKFNGCIRALED